MSEHEQQNGIDEEDDNKAGDEGENQKERERDEGFYRRFENLIPDVVKKGFLTGVGAVLLTEESIRHAVSEARLPKEKVKLLMAQADATKKEIFRMIGHEIRQFLEHVNLSSELAKAMTNLRMEVKAEISFSQRPDGSITPKVEVADVKTQRNDGPPEGSENGELP